MGLLSDRKDIWVADPNAVTFSYKARIMCFKRPRGVSLKQVDEHREPRTKLDKKHRVVVYKFR